MKPTTRVEITITDVKSPIAGTARGQRIKAAHPNDRGFRGATSFRAPFFIADAAVTCKSDVERFLRGLFDQGYYL